MVTPDRLRAERREEILRLAAGRGAHSLRVFGSVARGDANEDSDLDLLVAWELRLRERLVGPGSPNSFKHPRAHTDCQLSRGTLH